MFGQKRGIFCVFFTRSSDDSDLKIVENRLYVGL